MRLKGGGGVSLTSSDALPMMQLRWQESTGAVGEDERECIPTEVVLLKERGVGAIACGREAGLRLATMCAGQFRAEAKSVSVLVPPLRQTTHLFW